MAQSGQYGGEYNPAFIQPNNGQVGYANEQYQYQNEYGYPQTYGNPAETQAYPPQYGYQAPPNGWVQPGNSGILTAPQNQVQYQNVGQPVAHNPQLDPNFAQQQAYNEYGMPMYGNPVPSQPDDSLQAKINGILSQQGAKQINLSQHGGQPHQHVPAAPKDVPGSGRYSPNRLPFSPHRVYKRSNKLSMGDLGSSGVGNRIQPVAMKQTFDARLQQTVQQQGLAPQAVHLNGYNSPRSLGMPPANGVAGFQGSQVLQGPPNAVSGVYNPNQVAAPQVQVQQPQAAGPGNQGFVGGRLQGGLNPQPVPPAAASNRITASPGVQQGAANPPFNGQRLTGPPQ